MVFYLQKLLCLTVLLSTTTTSAAPTRTYCRCTIVSNAAPPPPIYSPSVAHWAPLDPSPSPAEAQDFCANLGPELENFPHAAEAFIASHSSDDEQHSPTTHIYVNLATKRNHDSNNEPRPTSRPHQRIVCHEEPEAVSAYQDTRVTLWTLHIIVALVIFSCLAEGVQAAFRWYRDSGAEIPNGEAAGYFRLQGSEKLLLALPTVQGEHDSMFSPGVEKKLRASSLMAERAPCTKREFIAYDDDEDDEANRPVM